MTHHDYFEAEFSLIEAYDCGEYSYQDAYRHCFKMARKLVWEAAC